MNKKLIAISLIATGIITIIAAYKKSRQQRHHPVDFTEMIEPLDNCLATMEAEMKENPSIDQLQFFVKTAKELEASIDQSLRNLKWTAAEIEQLNERKKRAISIATVAYMRYAWNTDESDGETLVH